MATDEKKAPKGKDNAQDDADFLKEAHKRYDASYERDRENVKEAYEDLEFLAGISQWDQKAKEMREAEGRPCLTINSLPTYVRQITGDMRQMRPSIKCVPVDDHGDEEKAEARAGVIRYVENRSKAQQAVYAKAADSQVACGVGAWRVRSEYSSPLTFNQDLRLELIEDPIAIRWDPDSSELSRCDAKFCFVPVDMSKEGFKARYADAVYEGFGTGNSYAPDLAEWASDDHVRVAEYWYKKPAKHRLVLLSNGSVFDLDDPNPKRAEQAALIVEQAKAAGMVEREDTRDIDEIWRAVISCSEVLERPTRWPGRFIPIIPVWGNEITIGRRVVRFGAIRFARDPQRMYNYSRSAQTEVVALQPKAPFIGTEKQFEQYQDIWATANTANHPYLPYTPDPQAPGAPQRVQPAVSSSGLAQEIALAAEDIKRTIGIFDASLGAHSNETSGRAILARQREGDVGSFVFIDNFSYAIQHTGTVLNDLIPHFYDTARVLRITGEDGKTEELRINQPAGVALDDQPEAVQNDLTVGAYDVVMSMGPSYTTRREEARDGMRELIQAAPALMPAIGDLYVKAQDWPMADDMAERLRLLAPAPIQKLIAEESGEPVQEEQPDPMQQQAAMLDLAIKDADRRLKDEQARKAHADANKAEAEAAQILMPMQLDPAAIEQRFAMLEHLLGQIGQAIAPPMPPQAPEMPQGGPMPPDLGQMQLPPQEPPPGGFFNGPTDPNGQPLA